MAMKGNVKLSKRISVLVKITKEKGFNPSTTIALKHTRAKYWVNLPDGRYFYILETYDGQWRQVYDLYTCYPTEHAAVEAGLEYILQECGSGSPYERMRVRERLFTVTVPCRMPTLHKPRSLKPKPHRVKTKPSL